MTNPVVTAVASGSWIIVATNVQDVAITPLAPTAIYTWTYRDTGDPAPTLANEQTALPMTGLTIQNSVAMDVYVWCKVAAGSVRVDEGLAYTYLIDA